MSCGLLVHPCIFSSQRRLLAPLTPLLLAALVQRDRAAADRALTGRFPSSELVPPLMTDALDFFLEIAAAGPESAVWGARAYISVDTRDIVGLGGFTGPPDERGFVTMGYSVFPEFQRRGYASEAAALALDYAFGSLALAEVVAFTTISNLRSRRVMERLHMRHDPADDFDHPALADGHPLRRHVLYRIGRADHFNLFNERTRRRDAP